MKIAALQKESFIDWEGYLSAVVFTKGCNFRCPFCHNAGLISSGPSSKMPYLHEAEILEYLSSRKGWLDALVITGGEPTLQASLPLFIEKIKRIGLLVKLDTNGSNPEMLYSLLEKRLVDYVAMDIKTSLKLKPYQEICGSEDAALLVKISNSIQILKEASIPYQLRTTVVPDYHSSEIIMELQTLFSYCDYRLQKYRKSRS